MVLYRTVHSKHCINSYQLNESNSEKRGEHFATLNADMDNEHGTWYMDEHGTQVQSSLLIAYSIQYSFYLQCATNLPYAVCNVQSTIQNSDSRGIMFSEIIGSFMYLYSVWMCAIVRFSVSTCNFFSTLLFRYLCAFFFVSFGLGHDISLLYRPEVQHIYIHNIKFHHSF